MQQPVDVDGGQSSLSQTQGTEDFREAEGTAAGAGRQHVGDLPGQAAATAAHVASNRRAGCAAGCRYEGARARGESIWPEIDYAASTVSAEATAVPRQRGCLVVRGHFDHQQARQWAGDIVDYAEQNRFFNNYRGPGDDFFGSVGSKPGVQSLKYPALAPRATD